MSDIIQSKPHYALLDGLRGVAALMVICYHTFEAFAVSPVKQIFNHGYLAVDFFFILSGFVIGYAYDDRWKTSLTIREFIKRRVIRLHPMVIIAAICGAVSFLIQGSVKWDGSPVSFGNVVVALMLTMLMIPAFPGTSADVRGFGEMFPLNGPSWSLFFEYIGNLLYALFLRRLSSKWLTVLLSVSGAGYLAFAVSNGSGFYNMGSGWSLADLNFLGGMLRLTFSFTMGLWIQRNFRPVKVKGAFWLCSAIIVLLLSIPYITLTGEASWLNGLYDSICTLVIFPIVVWIAASGNTTHRVSFGICKFLGEISYPVYIIHYPLMYLFFAWVWKNGLTFGQACWGALAVLAGAVTLAWLLMSIYDKPVRKLLTDRFK